MAKLSELLYKAIKNYHIDKRELLIYLLVWAVLLMLPFFKFDGNGIQLQDTNAVSGQMMELTPFLILFLIHSIIIIPYSFSKRRYTLYGVCTLLILSALYTGLWVQQKEFRDNFRREMHGITAKEFNEMRNSMDSIVNIHVSKHSAETIHTPNGRQERGRGHHKGHPPFWIGPLETRMLIAMLTLIANLGIHLLFRSLRDEERLKEMERERLKQELEYLKYQINPHFFMNTLNNIHALVDIDASKAKSSIIELSRLMRYVLYDGSAAQIPLAKDLDFIHHYVELMRLRYDDSVNITLDLPADAVPSLTVPPLLLITFVENAFKHGISYHQDSYIRIRLTVEDNVILFDCINSKVIQLVHPSVSSTLTPQHKESGIGLDNVRRRLNLLYPDSHKLNIKESETEFQVHLEINI